MRFMLLSLAILCSGCVAPTLTIYGRGMNADGKAVAVKEAQIYGDLVGNTTVQGSIVTVSSSGGYYNRPSPARTGREYRKWAISRPADCLGDFQCRST